MDLSLDDIVTLGRRRGRGGGAPRGTWGPGRRGGLVGTYIQTAAGRGGGAGTGRGGKDLRDVLATKQKMQVVDLRAKIKPKVSPVTEGRGRGRPHPPPQQRGGRMSAQFGTPKRARSRSPIKKPHPPSPPPAHFTNSRRRRESPTRLPSSAETKKITVTVPGLNRPVSEVSVGSSPLYCCKLAWPGL